MYNQWMWNESAWLHYSTFKRMRPFPLGFHGSWLHCL
jgi:hypothetical protein